MQGEVEAIEMKLIYIAHPYSGDCDRNRANAAKWCAWAATKCGVSPVADWIVLTSVLDESYRELGLACDVANVRRCDEVWLVGGRISDGMRVEAAAGKVVYDLTHLGFDVPEGEVRAEWWVRQVKEGERKLSPQAVESMARMAWGMCEEARLRRDVEVATAVVDKLRELTSQSDVHMSGGLADQLEDFIKEEFS
jgi:hypothetical protein